MLKIGVTSLYLLISTLILCHRYLCLGSFSLLPAGQDFVWTNNQIMSDPTEHELDLAAQVFAHYLGVDLEEESDLIPIVRAAMLDVPQGWEVGVGKDDHGGIPYFYNEDTGESLWKHPRESQCTAKVEEARKLKQPKRNRSHRVFTEAAREPRVG